MSALSMNALKVLELIQQDGATTKSRVMKACGFDADEARRAIIELLVEDQIVWMGARPRAGVFFALIENARKTGFGLMSEHGATPRGDHSGPRRASARATDVRHRILSYLEDEPDNPASIENFQEDVVPELGAPAIRRHLKLLENRGLVQTVPQRTGGRGRPWLGYLPVPEHERPIARLTDDPKLVFVNGARLRATTRADTREGGL